MVTCEMWSLRIPVGSKYMYMYNLRFDKETLCFGKLLFMRGGCNQRLQSLLNLSLITAHNAHEKQHCQDIRDKWACWYGLCLRTVAIWRAESVLQELTWHNSREHVFHSSYIILFRGALVIPCKQYSIFLLLFSRQFLTSADTSQSS